MGPTTATVGTPTMPYLMSMMIGTAASAQARPLRAKNGTNASETGQPRSQKLSCARFVEMSRMVYAGPNGKIHLWP